MPPEAPVAGGGDGQATLTVASKMSAYLRGGGVLIPLITVVLAFAVGGLVVLATGNNPLSTYQAVFEGSGLNWIFPWTEDRELAALNLQQTLIVAAPLMLVSLAVAFAFRAGLFNIGGQGQYLAGAIVSVYVASEVGGVGGMLLAIVAACVAGGVWAGIAGVLKATTGANEVISTIMLNWIALWVGFWLFGLGGPWQNDDPASQSIPVSNDIAEDARLHVFWGDPELQGLHIGVFIAIGALLVFWVLLNRSVTGYEVRAVGYNPEAAEYGGISAARNYVKVMVICGVFAGLGGAIDILGWQFRLNTNDIQFSAIGFLGIAVALLGRNTAFGTLLAAILFAGLLNGTSVRNLDPEIFDPQLATSLTGIIQGLVVLFVSAPVLVTLIADKLPGRRRKPEQAVEVKA